MKLIETLKTRYEIRKKLRSLTDTTLLDRMTNNSQTPQ